MHLMKPRLRDIAVEKAMSHPAITVAQDQSVQEAARLMRASNIGCLPVVRDEMLIGIVTDRDIVMRLCADNHAADSITVSELMSKNVSTCNENCSLDFAVHEMERNGVRRLVVTDGAKITGLISTDDIAKFCNEPLAMAMTTIHENGRSRLRVVL